MRQNCARGDTAGNEAPGGGIHVGSGSRAAPVLQVDDLRVVLRSHGRAIAAVRSISFDVKAGEVLGIVGESGSGKSILMKTIMGLTSSYPGVSVDGAIRLLDRRIDDLPRAELRQIQGRQIAMVFQDPMTALDPLMRVGAQVVEAIRAHEDCGRDEARTAALAALRDAELEAEKVFDAYPHELSGGMRQRVMIAMALACSPAVLIADEPTTALDVTTQARIVRLLKRLRVQREMSVLFVTHDIALVLSIADRIMVMYAGQAVEVGVAAEVFARPRHPYTAALLQASPRVRAPGQRLTAIRGAPPNLSMPVEGCAFSPRCAFAVAQCRAEEPSLEQERRRPGHLVRCWLEEAHREQVLWATGGKQSAELRP